MALEFFWDDKSQRYRDKESGKYLSEQQVRSLTTKAIEQVKADMYTIADLLIDGKISVATWEGGTQEAIKRLHTWNYLLGIGGEKRMNEQEYGVLKNLISNQYEHLRGFAETLINKGMSEAQFLARLDMYAAAGNGSFEKAKEEGHKKAGFFWERRHRTKSNSCQPCVSYAGAGWQPIGTLPSPMQECDCHSNCGCYKRFSDSVERPQDMLIKGFGWLKDNAFQSNLMLKYY